MDRRETIKSILIGSVAGGVAGGGLLLAGCAPGEKDNVQTAEASDGLYGRTEKEKARDARVMGESFFTPHEIATVAVLCDLILPATPGAGSATEAGVHEFIAFIVKDIQSHQLPMRGGLMWLDHFAMTGYAKAFIECPADQQKEMLDAIAYPNDAAPEVQQGVHFFSLMRNLVLTGYYTSKMGIKDLSYQGNVPNVWDGVPADVLAKHGLSYDEAWLAKCVDQEKRAIKAEWDEEGNLLT